MAEIYDWDLEPPDSYWEQKRRRRSLYGCVVCGESVPRYGARCERCRASLEIERLDKETRP